MSTPAADRETVVRVETLDDGAIWCARLNTPNANILDRDKVEALASLFDRARRDGSLKAVILEGEGPNFSFGASVQEHLPEHCAGMLSSFHGLFRTMLDASVVTMAAVRGQCLGGGLELAAFCHRVFAAPGATLLCVSLRPLGHSMTRLTESWLPSPKCSRLSFCDQRW
jgi:cyclohexa-1,5-dienecarbonyl-CoA hydratase